MFKILGINVACKTSQMLKTLLGNPKDKMESGTWIVVIEIENVEIFVDRAQYYPILWRNGIVLSSLFKTYYSKKKGKN